MIIQTATETSVQVINGVESGIKGTFTVYGTSVERLAMTAEVKARFTPGSTFVETNTGTVYIFDGIANDFVPF